MKKSKKVNNIVWTKEELVKAGLRPSEINDDNIYNNLVNDEGENIGILEFMNWEEDAGLITEIGFDLLEAEFGKKAAVEATEEQIDDGYRHIDFMYIWDYLEAYIDDRKNLCVRLNKHIYKTYMENEEIKNEKEYKIKPSRVNGKNDNADIACNIDYEFRNKCFKHRRYALLVR